MPDKRIRPAFAFALAALAVCAALTSCVSDAGKLVGTWMSDETADAMPSAVFVFFKDGSFYFGIGYEPGAEPSGTYSARGGYVTLRRAASGDVADYPYTLSGDRLSFKFDDTRIVVFTKTK